jgi:hypothetical protein
MLIAGDEIIEQLLTGPLGHGQHAEAEIDHIHRPAPIEVPSVARSRRKRHLARR